MRYRKYIFYCIFLAIVISMNSGLILSETLVGNLSADVETYYPTSGVLKGWINISLLHESVDSMLTALGQEIKIIDFLRNQSYTDYNCTPADCSVNLEGSNESTSKEFSLISGSNKVVGLKFNGNLVNEPVSSLSFKVESNADSSCYQQLKIDLEDDNDIDWLPTQGYPDYDCTRAATCFNELESSEDRIIDDKGFCDKVTVPALPIFKVGANITKGTTANPGLKMIVYNLDMEKYANGECSLSVNSSGENSCIVNIKIANQTEIIVCIKADVITDYKIKAETVNPCGFYDIEGHSGYTADYPIFVQGGKYAPINNFTFNSDSFRAYESEKSYELIPYINQYLDDKYDYNCINGCVVPMKFIGGTDQSVKLSNLNLVYTSDSGPISSNKFYDINKNSAKVNMNYQKLDIEKANFSVSSTTGNVSLGIYLEERLILRKYIIVKILPKITSLSPLEAPAGVPVNFIATVKNYSGNLSYKWSFGDNSSEEITYKNSVMHTYPAIKDYQMKLTVTSASGDSSESTFTVKSVSPKAKINETIVSYKNDLVSFETQANKLETFLKNIVMDNTDYADIKDSISGIEKRYQEGFIDDAKAVDIIKQLYGLKVPYKIQEIQKVNPASFYLDETQIDLAVLDDLGAGKIDPELSRRDYIGAINSWLINNLNVMVGSKSYSVLARNSEDIVIGSIVDVSLEPKKDIDEFYFVINGDRDKIQLNGDFNVNPTSTSNVMIEFSSITENKPIEFFYPEKLQFSEMPIYFSPQFSELDLIVTPPICNANKICEKDNGEDYSNCSDCSSPWLLKYIIYIIIVIAIAFILYIILQEWYKRNYEKSLFKNKNQLFNLINFMYICERQNMSKNQIYKKLKDSGWSGEQLEYAWRKLHGKRTGMWEIPIFKGRENRQVDREIQARMNEKENPRF
jgi:hypothetical protein